MQCGVLVVLSLIEEMQSVNPRGLLLCEWETERKSPIINGVVNMMLKTINIRAALAVCSIASYNRARGEG